MSSNMLVAISRRKRNPTVGKVILVYLDLFGNSEWQEKQTNFSLFGIAKGEKHQTMVGELTSCDLTQHRLRTKEQANLKLDPVHGSLAKIPF